MKIDEIRKFLSDAYWVVPDVFLAGPYPEGWGEESVRRKIDTLIETGIALFVNLTRPGELQPYEEILYQQARVYGKDVEHWRAPIIDLGVPNSDQMTTILDIIDDAINDSRHVYVHCHAGIGRTGTIVGCYLVRHGMDPEIALDQIAKWREDLPTGFFSSPENDDQRNMILNWQVGQ